MTDRNNDGHDAARPGTALVPGNNHGPDAVKTIVINGREHRYAGDRIGRNELARMAFPALQGIGQSALTIAYDHGPSEAPNGVLSAERTTRVLHGQTFSVSCTDKS